MLFAIHALDFTGALPTRLANYDAHKAFLSDTALWRQDCDMRPAVAAFSWSNRGRDEVEAINRADPFTAAGIWERVSITGFVRRQC